MLLKNGQLIARNNGNILVHELKEFNFSDKRSVPYFDLPEINSLQSDLCIVGSELFSIPGFNSISKVGSSFSKCVISDIEAIIQYLKLETGDHIILDIGKQFINKCEFHFDTTGYAIRSVERLDNTSLIRQLEYNFSEFLNPGISSTELIDSIFGNKLAVEVNNTIKGISITEDDFQYTNFFEIPVYGNKFTETFVFSTFFDKLYNAISTLITLYDIPSNTIILSPLLSFNPIADNVRKTFPYCVGDLDYFDRMTYEKIPKKPNVCELACFPESFFFYPPAVYNILTDADGILEVRRSDLSYRAYMDNIVPAVDESTSNTSKVRRLKIEINEDEYSNLHLQVTTTAGTKHHGIFEKTH